jgi:spore germination cell wall hydrolase CwlJ-like protein
MTAADEFMTALCLWREARGEGESGMTAVACVIRNRAAKHKTSPYVEIVRPWAFSSITAHGDPQLSTWPKDGDSTWIAAQKIAARVLNESTPDITRGSTLYFDSSISFPKTWNRAAVEPTVKIGRLNFYREA